MKKTRAFLLGSSGMLVGLLAGTYVTLSPSSLLLIGLLLILFILFVWKIRLLRLGILCMLFIILGTFYTRLWILSYERKIEEQPALVTGQIIECAQKIRSFDCIMTTSKLRLVFRTPSPFTPGGSVTVSGSLQQVGERDRSLLGDGVMAQINDPTLISNTSNPRSIRTILWKIRTRAEENLQASLTEPSASLASGLLFGSKQAFSRDLLDALKRTNTTHLIAVSGFNITILAEVIRRSLLRLPRKIVFVVSSALVILFVLMIGAPPSAVRAAIMGVALLFGQLIGRKAYMPSLLTATALLMTLPNPYLMRFNLSFQLSFLAFAGLGMFSPWLERRLQPLPQQIRSLAAATLGATLATSPILVPLSGYVSLVGPLVNVLVLPLVPLLMGLAGVVLVLSIISIQLAQLVGLLLYLPSTLMVRTIEAGSRIPAATVAWPIGIAVFLIFVLTTSRSLHAHTR